MRTMVHKMRGEGEGKREGEEKEGEEAMILIQWSTFSRLLLLLLL